MLNTKHRLKVKSANYLKFTPFCIFHPKVPSKHKTKNIRSETKQTLKRRCILKNKSRHAINKVYRLFKRIVPKSQWGTTLAYKG
jgi:hypothetical protein